MKTIYKFPLHLDDCDAETISAPGLGNIVLCAAQQPHHWVVWAEVDTDKPVVSKEIYVVDTGHPCPSDSAVHVGSYIDGPFVWHVYTYEDKS